MQQNAQTRVQGIKITYHSQEIPVGKDVHADMSKLG